jgi:hypothetical protein
MFGFLRKSGTTAAAENITDYTIEIIEVASPFEISLASRMDTIGAQGALQAIRDAALDPKVRRLVTRLQFSLKCGIPLERISTELIEPLLSKYSSPLISGVILKSIFRELLLKAKENKPFSDFEQTWPEIRTKVMERALGNETGTQPSDHRFLNLYEQRF